MLARYASGIVAAQGTARAAWLERVGRRRPEALNRVVGGVPPGGLWSLAPVEALARLTARAARAAGGRLPSTYDALLVAHGAGVAALPWPAGIDAVYAYEDGALRTFQRARRRGLGRVWDLPLPHYETIARIWRDESARWPGAMGAAPPEEPPWKRARKDAEL